MAATLRQVAERAGVSVRTASYILNGRGPRSFRPQTIDRVERAAEELRYRPNRLAQAVRSGRFGAVGLVLSTEAGRSNLPDALLGGIHDALAESELQLTVSRLPGEKLTDRGYVPHLLRTWMVDGLLINYTDNIPPYLIDVLENSHVPAVWLNTRRPKNCVHPDDFSAGRQATEQLLGLNHRRIAYIDFSHGYMSATAHYSAADRLGGYERAMSEAGLAANVTCRDPNVVHGDATGDVDALLSGADRPTAIVSYSLRMAETVLVVASRRGLTVPDDLSLVCFDTRSSSHLGLPITTWTVPCREVGTAAVQMLRRRIDAPELDEPAQAVAFGREVGGTCVQAPADRN